MIFKRGGFSGLIKPILYILDLLVINLLAFYLPFNFINPFLFHSYITALWIILSLKNEFYDVRRYTKATQILILIFRQFIFFFLILYAFIGFFKEFKISRILLAQYFFTVFLLVALLKFLSHYLLMKYRERLKGNVRNVVVIGDSKKSEQLIEMFNSREEYGYDFKKQFHTKQTPFILEHCFDYISSNNIDEIYCSVSELKNSEITEIIDYADNNLKEVKFIPDNKFIFTKKLKFEYYDYIPILSLREIPLDDPINAFIKRLFDLVFSSVVIFFILSWLTPIVALLIRMESKGPIFFRQRRNGLDNKEFDCYKFRSMAMNEDSDNLQATKGDMRITKVGRFIRKTSIDELPQFYNVFAGKMSVVGPRPHMVKHTNLYSQKIDKYMVRHFVKPGITGLAQVRGYRGEVETDNDIINRIKFDIFYIENWSIFLDIKIIIQTIVNALKGEEKAY